MSALDDFLTEHIDVPDDDEERARFRVDGPSTAEWALRKLRQALDAQEQARAVAADEIARIQEWRDREVGVRQRDVDFFQGLLADYHRAVLAENPESKTIRLPAGQLRARKMPDTVDVKDLDALTEWARANERDELLRVKVEANKAVIKKLPVSDGRVVDPETGEAIPGVTVETGDVRFTAEVAR